MEELLALMRTMKTRFVRTNASQKASSWIPLKLRRQYAWIIQGGTSVSRVVPVSLRVRFGTNIW